MRVAWALIIFTWVALLADLASVCRWVIELPSSPLTASIWATFYWLLALWMTVMLERARAGLRLRRALAAGPPQVWVIRPPGRDMLPTPIPQPMGIDPLGSPSWLVPDIALVDGDQLMIEGLTRYAAIYIATDFGPMARLENSR